MKKLLVLLVSLGILAGSSSCVIVAPKHDNGKHRGWYKNRHNPHHPASNNPGGAQKSPGNSKKGKAK